MGAKCESERATERERESERERERERERRYEPKEAEGDEEATDGASDVLSASPAPAPALHLHHSRERTDNTTTEATKYSARQPTAARLPILVRIDHPAHDAAVQLQLGLIQLLFCGSMLVHKDATCATTSCFKDLMNFLCDSFLRYRHQNI